MADDNLQVKIDADSKELFEKMWSESGQSKKDFMASVIAQHQSYLLQNGSDLGIPELASLEQHVRRIVEIYTALAGSRQDIADNSAKKQIESANELTRIKAELLDAQQLIKTAESDAKTLINTTIAETDAKILASESRIDDLLKKALTAEETANLSKQLLESERKMRLTAESTIVELKNTIVELKNTIDSLTNTVTELNDRIDNIDNNNAVILNKTIKDLNDKHKKEIASNKERSDFEIEKAVLVANKIAFEQRQNDLLELDRLRKLVTSQVVEKDIVKED